MNSLRIVLSTIDSEENAQKLALQLVEERLAACVNIIPNVVSVYKWKGATEQAGEYLLMVKTAADRLDHLVGRIKELHPYEVPEVITLDVENVLSSYLDWVISETRSESR